MVEYETHSKLVKAAIEGDIKVFVADTPTVLAVLAGMKELQPIRYSPKSPLYTSDFMSAVKEGNVELIGRIEEGRFLLDVRTMADEDHNVVIKAVSELVSGQAREGK